MAIKPITGMLRRTLITDLTVGLAVGMVFGTAFWHGYHMPRTNARDNFYAKLEQERATEKA